MTIRIPPFDRDLVMRTCELNRHRFYRIHGNYQTSGTWKSNESCSTVTFMLYDTLFRLLQNLLVQRVLQLSSSLVLVLLFVVSYVLSAYTVRSVSCRDFLNM